MPPYFNFYNNPSFWSDMLHDKAAFYFAKQSAHINEHIPHEQLKKLRFHRLKKLFLHAKANIPFYKKLYEKYTPAAPSEETLNNLPVVTKQMLKKAEVEHVRDVETYRTRGFASSTSGSTGEPLSFLLDKAYRTAKKATAERVWEFVDGSNKVKKIYCSAPRNPTRWPNTITLHPHLLKEKSSEYAIVIKESRASAIFGNPFITYEFFKALYEQNLLEEGQFKIAAFAGQELPEGIKTFFREKMKTEVTQYYALMELGIVGMECAAHNGLHIQEENMIVEVVDDGGKPVPQGKTGSIVITSLCNDVMPFIRYSTGDRGMFLKKPCPCGRTLRRLVVEGRDDDLFLISGNKVYYSTIFRDALDKYFKYFERYQMEQIGPESFVLRIIPRKAYSKAVEEEVAATLSSLFAEKVQILIEERKNIEPLPNGKFKQFISQQWRERFNEQIK